MLQISSNSQLSIVFSVIRTKITSLMFVFAFTAFARCQSDAFLEAFAGEWSVMSAVSNYVFEPTNADRSCAEHFSVNLSPGDRAGQLIGTVNGSDADAFLIESAGGSQYSVAVLRDSAYVKLADFVFVRSRNGVLSSVGAVGDVQFALNVIKDDAMKLVVYNKSEEKLITYNLKRKFQFRSIGIVRTLLPLFSILRSHFGKR